MIASVSYYHMHMFVHFSLDRDRMHLDDKVKHTDGFHMTIQLHIHSHRTMISDCTSEDGDFHGRNDTKL